MRFDDYPLLEFRTLLFKKGFDTDQILDFLSSIGALSSVPVWKVTGDLSWRNYHLRIEDSAITELNRQWIFRVSWVLGKASALNFDHGSVSFG